MHLVNEEFKLTMLTSKYALALILQFKFMFVTPYTASFIIAIAVYVLYLGNAL